MEFSLSEWIEKHEIGEDVQAALKKEGLLGQKAHKCLCLIENQDLKDLRLCKADFLLLKEAVKEIQEDNGGGPLCGPTIGVPLGAPAQKQKQSRMTLDDLLQPVQGQGKQPRSDRVDLDPSVYLTARRKDSGESALRVVDFISSAARESEEIDLGGGISLKMAGQKQKLERVSPAMWMAANGRIMAELIKNGELDTEESVFDYIAYTVKVSELACRYTWASVLMYDDEYRSLQAATGHRWGADTPHLSVVALREKPIGTGQQRQQPGTNVAAPNKRRTNAKGIPFCLQWNKGNCTYGDRCNFDHSCATCGKADHPSKDHALAGSGKAAAAATTSIA
ncbi:hypothetical protein V1264_005878 [Littorina saxatilis]|uniref:C3H1-type domain-containing protein n=1 Tax=Littorina saxatilis TaxID=31220 RepID=A0AAN9G6D3_9CAEN